MDNTVLQALRYDPQRGALLFNDVRYLLVRPETLMAFQRAAAARLGAEADALLYESGFTGGRLSAMRYRELFQLSDAETVEFMAHMGSEIGWGRMAVEHFDPAGRELVLGVEHSPFAAAYGAAESGVCHLIRGVFAGLADGLFGWAVEAREEACLAMGDERCRIRIRGLWAHGSSGGRTPPGEGRTR